MKLKKILALTLVFAMCLSFFPSAVFATDDAEVPGTPAEELVDANAGGEGAEGQEGQEDALPSSGNEGNKNEEDEQQPAQNGEGEGEAQQPVAPAAAPVLRGKGPGGGTIVTAPKQVAAMVYYEASGYEDGFYTLQDAVQSAGAAYYNPDVSTELWGILLPEVTMAQAGTLSGSVALKNNISLNLNGKTLTLDDVNISGGTLTISGPGSVVGYSSIANLAVANGSYVKADGTVAQGYLVTFVSEGTTVDTQEIAIGGKATAPSGITKANYDLTSWNVNNSAWNFDTTVGSSMTLTAAWTAHPYAISYDLDGGSVASANPASYTVETQELALVSPSKQNFVFQGWFTDSQFNDPFSFAPGTTVGDITLYAKYGPAEANIGNVGYATLAEAIAAAGAGDTVELAKDISGSSTVTIPAGKTITLDLNGHSIEAAESSTGRHYYAIENHGTLTLKDSEGNGFVAARGISCARRAHVLKGESPETARQWEGHSQSQRCPS